MSSPSRDPPPVFYRPKKEIFKAFSQLYLIYIADFLMKFGWDKSKKFYLRMMKMVETNYSKHGDYILPNLLPPQENSDYQIGKYSKMRLDFLKNHRRVTFINLLTSGKLYKHLSEVDTSAKKRLEYLIYQMLKAQGVTEELKEANQLEWVGRMNNIINSAEEIILKELIYA